MNTRGYTDAQRSEAAEWFVMIRETEDPELETLQAWMRWLDASESHRLAFEAVEQTWHQTPSSLALAMPTAAEVAADDYDGAEPVAVWHRRAKVVDEQKRRSTWRWPAFATLAAAAALAVVMVSRFGWDFGRTPTAPFAGEFTTRTGEHLEVVLADGSRVSLGAKSRISVDFTEQQRAVHLTGGEAFFSVSKDRARPFVVHALNGTITAIGTAFNVRTSADRVMVVVTEGAVKVNEPAAKSAGAAAAEQRLESGQQLTFGAQTSATSPQVAAAPDSGARARWREGWLVYRNEPLREVIADITRYTDRQVAIADAAAAERRFSGAVYKTDIDEWISALPESFPVKIDLRDGRTVIATR